MQTFKRSAWSWIKSILLAPFAALGIFFVVIFALQFFSLGEMDVYLVVGLPALALLIGLYMAFFSENIKFEIEPEGECRYYKAGKLKKKWDLKRCTVGYRHKTTTSRGSTTHDIDFKIRDEAGAEESVDCSALGPTRFQAMFALMESYNPPAPEQPVVATGDSKYI